MHLGHRRANSYSTTATGSTESVHSPPPPPSIIARRLNQETADVVTQDIFETSNHETNFVRASHERRSYTFTEHSSESPRVSRGYKGVTVLQAKPASIRYSVQPQDYDWLFDMNRPRSPSKSWKNGGDAAGVPALDQALAVIKEQLAMLKSERIEMSQRVDDFSTEVKTVEKCIKREASCSLAAHSTPQRSPLRRIKSVEPGRAQSHTHLDYINIDSSGGEEEEEQLERPPVGMKLFRKKIRKFSVPSKVSSASTTPTHTPTRRLGGPNSTGHSLYRSSSSNGRSLQGLETIHDSSPHLNANVFSPDTTPESSPKLVRVRSVHSINGPYSKVLVAPRHSRSNSQTVNCFNTLPSRKTSSGSSSYIYDDNMSESMSIPEGLCDDISILSESSMVMRISSATGQVEKVPRSSYTSRKLYASSSEDSPSHYIYKRQSALRSEDIDNNLIINLTEEPRPLSLCFEPDTSTLKRHYSANSPPPFVQSPPIKRTNMLLHSIETTV